MQAAFRVKSLALGVLLLCTALGCAGLGLGRAQGAVFVGKALDVHIQLILDVGEEIQSACMGADVFYGETPLETARVSVTVEPATANGAKGTTVRVVSSVLIDEPIVTVNLRAGCAQKSSRRYTLFPEVSTNVVEPILVVPQARPATTAPPPPPTPAAAIATPTTTAVALSVTPAPVPSTAPGDLVVAGTKKPRPTGAEGSNVAKPVRLPPAATAPVSSVARAKPNQTPGRARLKLDPMDLLIEYSPVLRASDELLTLPQENAEKRAEAAAQWRALNTNPTDILRESAQAQNLENDLKSLYAVTAENQKGLLELVAKVQRAESERYANGLVYALAALCLASLAALAWVWRRSRTTQPRSWQQGWDAGDSLLSDRVLAPEAPQAPDPEPVVPAAFPAGKATDVAELDFDLDLMAASPQAPAAPIHVAPATALSPTSTPRPLARDLVPSTFAGLRSNESEDVLDVRQQADFFVSLGEHQKAIEVLTARIAQCGESSPLVCLDLLKIYHALGRESEFEFMRTEFNAWFTGYVPALASFRAEGRSLEHYPQILDQIVALWPQADVLEYIESCMYHHATDADGPSFDLDAYRDLLFLHAIAKRIVRRTEDAGDSQASELIRIPPRAPVSVLGYNQNALSIGEVVHRAGAEHRGAWKRTLPLVEEPDPELELETRGTPLGAMKVPPYVAPPPEPDDDAMNPDSERDQGPLTDFNFLSLR